MPTYDYKCEKCGIIEIFHQMSEHDKTVCPECNTKGLEKQIGSGSGFIMKNKQANQYNDIRKARYWRDHNGVRHKVTDADGYSHSPTPSSKQTKSPEEVAAIKRNARAMEKKRREKESYRRYVEKVKRLKRQ